MVNMDLDLVTHVRRLYMNIQKDIKWSRTYCMIFSNKRSNFPDKVNIFGNDILVVDEISLLGTLVRK
ncbi:hypothetical protein BpHYR1_022926 [Brachionus plicatilis]|uniref:Uncharacterized protein n=1 Tax=Brachionus plicatilis TaxID=10195 RepID=A0A3M7T5H5_BRAPC|nr:hypothetical protein BpHYR1_022926 [Brachionus plicatilis]